MIELIIVLTIIIASIIYLFFKIRQKLICFYLIVLVLIIRMTRIVFFRLLYIIERNIDMYYAITQTIDVLKIIQYLIIIGLCIYKASEYKKGRIAS